MFELNWHVPVPISVINPHKTNEFVYQRNRKCGYISFEMKICQNKKGHRIRNLQFLSGPAKEVAQMDFRC